MSCRKEGGFEDFEEVLREHGRKFTYGFDTDGCKCKVPGDASKTKKIASQMIH